jgi:SIR2-like protein
MPLFDQRIIRKINQGRAFALVGSGPSSEIGYPSWGSLATGLTEYLRAEKRLSDEASYKKYLDQKKYPELFSQAERDLGSREELVSFLSKLLRPPAKQRGSTYEILANWPFACYLTTNWDDEISAHLADRKIYFQTLQNSKEDLAQIRGDATGLIVKLHSDLAHPKSAVITADDYSALQTGRYSYLRDRLKAIFEMFDVLVVGHSLVDPDLNLILQVAKESAHPEHPVFFIAADLTNAEIRDYLNRYNIVAISYPNLDGTHSQLRRTLGLFDRFIMPRRKRLDLKTVSYSPAELEAAQAVAVYRRLVNRGKDELSPTLYLEPLILRSLETHPGPCILEQLLKTAPLSSVCATEDVRTQVEPVLDLLKKESTVLQTEEGFSLTEGGAKKASEITTAYSRELDQAYGQFAVELTDAYPGIEKAEVPRLSQLL